MFWLIFSGVSFGEDIPGHSELIKEIIAIHYQMTALDEILAKDPENKELQLSIERMEEVLIRKMREYNQTKNAVPQKIQ